MNERHHSESCRRQKGGRTVRSVREVLRERLSPADYQRLEELTQGWQEIPFEYYPDCNAFQTSDEWELEPQPLG